MPPGHAPRPEIDIRWQEFAACASAPRDLFFPDTKTWDDPQLRAYVADLAATYCIGCPVRLDCLTHALTFPEKHGIWAGTTPPDRQLANKAELTPAELLRIFEDREIPPLAPEEIRTA